MLNRHAYTYRYRRFADTLTSANARLAVEVVVGISFPTDLHR